MQKYVLIAIGGAFGSMARYAITSACVQLLGSGFPYGTLAVNLIACFVIGFAIVRMTARTGKQSSKTSPWRYLLAVGFIGAFSTFSTFEWETFATLRSGAVLSASIYAAVSLGLGLVAVWTGTRLTRRPA